jgi:hypothetical protein
MHKGITLLTRGRGEALFPSIIVYRAGGHGRWNCCCLLLRCFVVVVILSSYWWPSTVVVLVAIDGWPWIDSGMLGPTVLDVAFYRTAKTAYCMQFPMSLGPLTVSRYDWPATGLLGSSGGARDLAEPTYSISSSN